MENNSTATTATFIRIARLGLIMIYLVIIAGAVVRMTGSGMGCPDWPRCFGMWVPPTDVSQLPADYQETYAHRGYADTSFNVFHTWTEYVNRLTGALTGFVLLSMLFYSLKFWKTDRRLVWWCLLAVFAIGFQGWLGKVVVDSVLTPVKITIHMLMALVMVGIQLWIIIYARKLTGRLTGMPFHFKALLAFAVFLTLVQVALGTQVREQIDEIATSLQYTSRDIWVNQLTGIFKIHRTFSIAVLLLNIYVVLRLYRAGQRIRPAGSLLLLLTLEILTGVILTYFSMPAFIQPIHLLLASVIFGVQVYLLLQMVRVKTS
jgi:cytochrome c oxidase assembly protein subunit 15